MIDFPRSVVSNQHVGRRSCAISAARSHNDVTCCANEPNLTSRESSGTRSRGARVSPAFVSPESHPILAEKGNAIGGRAPIAIGGGAAALGAVAVRTFPPRRGPIPARSGPARGGTRRNTECAPRRFTIINCGVARACMRVYVYTYRGSMVLL